MAKLIYSTLLIPLMFIEYLYCYECGTHIYDDGEDGIIQSPGFPAPFPDGPYNCTYIITNPYGGDVLLEFTDFVTHSELHYSHWCRETLFITFVKQDSPHYDPGYPICHYMSVYHTWTGSNTTQVTFQVPSSNLFRLPGFRAKYSMVPYNYSLMFQHGGTLKMETVPYEKANHKYDTVLPPSTENYTSTVINIVKAYPGFQVAWSFSGIEQWTSQNGSEFILEIRDGPTSMSPLIAEWTNLSQVHNVYSESGYMYIRYTKNYISYFIPGSHIFFKKTYPCPVGFFQCVQSGYCIGTSAVCDGTDHCGDNSDETAPYCGNDLIDTCYGDLPCVEDQSHYECEYSYCYCQTGYDGDKCEYGNFECPFTCQNGGNCSDYRCRCAIGFQGDKCEIENVCETPCQNGGTCSDWGSCYCPSDYYGNACENKIYYHENNINDSGSSATGISLAVMLPLILVIVCSVACCVALYRKAIRRLPQNSTVFSSATFTANQTTVYVDNPPMYQDIVTPTAGTNGIASDEPDGYIEEEPATPPPTYESATMTIETTPSTMSENVEAVAVPSNATGHTNSDAQTGNSVSPGGNVEEN